jgi:hypothetical protein
LGKVQKKKVGIENLVEQVDEVVKIMEFTYQRKQAEILFDKIYGQMINFEIFNEKQLDNVIQALIKMHSENLVNMVENNVPSKLAKILSSSYYPEKMRLEIAKIFSDHIKNKTIKKYFLTKQVIESLIHFIDDYREVASNLSHDQKEGLINA